MTKMTTPAQCAVALAFYLLHLLVLSKSSVPFPVQIIPNNMGLLHSLGLDSVAGLITIGVALRVRALQGLPLMPSLFSPDASLVPWQPPRSNIWLLYGRIFLLILGYLGSGRAGIICDNLLHLAALVGIPISVAMHRSLQVLFGHLVWVGVGVGVLSSLKGFFNKNSTFMRVRVKENWVWWAIGGYFVSALFFNMADVCNQILLPAEVFDAETVVTKMINPENNDILAMAVGSVAPCVTAPWWEEVFYRGFILPVLCAFLPINLAIPTSAVLFAVHHWSWGAMLPLTVLGLFWAMLYALSGNLLVTMIIHAMWNSRVFLGSLLGL